MTSQYAGMHTMEKIDEGRVLGALKACLTTWASCRGLDVADLTPSFCPIVQLKGFDSYAAIEVTAMMEAELGLEIPDDSRDPLFWTVDSDKRNLREISQFIAGLF